MKDMHVLYVLSLWRMEGEINKNEGRRVFFHKYECQNRLSQLIHMKTQFIALTINDNTDATQSSVTPL